MALSSAISQHRSGFYVERSEAPHTLENSIHTTHTYRQSNIPYWRHHILTSPTPLKKKRKGVENIRRVSRERDRLLLRARRTATCRGAGRHYRVLARINTAPQLGNWSPLSPRRLQMDRKEVWLVGHIARRLDFKEKVTMVQVLTFNVR